jgi:hypothetical protein
MSTILPRYYTPSVLRVFFTNLKKNSFAQSSILFLGFLVSSNGVSIDSEKVWSILEWLTPKNIHDAIAFTA